jgi:hypothetical protein
MSKKKRSREYHFKRVDILFTNYLHLGWSVKIKKWLKPLPVRKTLIINMGGNQIEVKL